MTDDPPTRLRPMLSERIRPIPDRETPGWRTLRWRGLYGQSGVLPDQDRLRVLSESTGDDGDLRGLLDAFHDALFRAIVDASHQRHDRACRPPVAVTTTIEGLRGRIFWALAGLPVRVRRRPILAKRGDRSTMGCRLGFRLGRVSWETAQLVVRIGPSRRVALRRLLAADATDRRARVARIIRDLVPADHAVRVEFVALPGQVDRVRVGASRLGSLTFLGVNERHRVVASGPTGEVQGGQR